MDAGYCTLFLIKIDLWSGGGLPIDLSPWSMDEGLVVGLVKLMGYIFVLEFYKNILHFCLLIINLLQVDVVLGTNCHNLL